MKEPSSSMPTVQTNSRYLSDGRGYVLTVVNSIGGFSIFLAGKAAGVRPSTQRGTSRLHA